MKLNAVCISTLAACLFAPQAAAQGFSIWGAAQGGFGGTSNTIHARASAGIGMDLPLGFGTVGLEVTPFGLAINGRHVYDIAAVLRDVPIPFTPISVRAEVGFEKTTSGGLFDSTPLFLFAGGGVRYMAFGPLGLVGNVRAYFTNLVSAFAVSVGIDLKF